MVKSTAGRTKILSDSSVLLTITECPTCAVVFACTLRVTINKYIKVCGKTERCMCHVGTHLLFLRLQQVKMFETQR